MENSNLEPCVNSYSIENDPLYKPIDPLVKDKIDKAAEKQIRSMSINENVDTDSTKLPNQNYALIKLYRLFEI